MTIFYYYYSTMILIMSINEGNTDIDIFNNDLMMTYYY